MERVGVVALAPIMGKGDYFLVSLQGRRAGNGSQVNLAPLFPIIHEIASNTSVR
jgi:hypothetical protein